MPAPNPARLLAPALPESAVGDVSTVAALPAAAASRGQNFTNDSGALARALPVGPAAPKPGDAVVAASSPCQAAAGLLSASIAPSSPSQLCVDARNFLARFCERSRTLTSMLAEANTQPAIIFLARDALHNLGFEVLSEQAVADAYASCAFKPGVNLARRVLVELGINAGLCGAVPKWGTKEWTAINNRLRARLCRRVSVAKLPERPMRKPDADKHEQWRALVEFAGGALRRAQQTGPRDDVDPRFAETTSRTALLDGLFAQCDRATGDFFFASAAERIWRGLDRKEGPFKNPGPLPTRSTILRKIAALHGPADRLRDYDDYTRRFWGWQAEYPDQGVGFDASGLDVEVQNAWGDIRSGKPMRWAFFTVDAASGYQTIYAPECGSEQAGWKGGACDWLVKQLRHAPEYVFTDRVSSLFEVLGALAPGDCINRQQGGPPLGIYFLLACGARPKVGKPETPTNKAFVERGIGIAKDQFGGILECIAGEREHAGILPLHDARGRRLWRRRFDNEPAFQQAIRRLTNHVNNLPNFRDSGKSRAELWNDPESQRRREERRLVPDAWNRFLEMLKDVRVGVVEQGNLLCMHRGGIPVGQLNAPVAEDDAGAVMLLLPGGLLASDAPGLLRCYAIRKRQGLTAISLYEGRACELSRFGYQGIPRPVGEYRLRAETELERQRHAAQTAAAKYEKSLPEQHTASAPAAPASLPAALPLPAAAASQVDGETAEQIMERVGMRAG